MKKQESTTTKPKPKRVRPRTTAAKRTRNSLVQAPPGKQFWVNHGPVLSNLRELRDLLAGGLSDVQFAHHVGAGKNDFARWVEDVLEDATCAASLRRTRTRAATLRAVERALARYRE